MVDFNFPEARFNPELVEIPASMDEIKAIIEDCEDYNRDSRLWKIRDEYGNEIPMKYRGRNRYWITKGETEDTVHGPYTNIQIYDLDPEAKDHRRLIAKYKIVSEDGTVMQTIEQAERHVMAARLEAERVERMALKDPKLNSSINIHMPLLYHPDEARKVIDARLNPE